MYKKVLALFLTVVLLVAAAPAVFADDLMEDTDYYAKQNVRGTCTLASAAMMLRRRAYLDGFANWTDVTENDVRGTAWYDGLTYDFTYQNMRVKYSTLSGSAAEKEQQLITLLAEHPEGIVVYDRSAPHAILLTDYTDGTFYCADPADGTGYGRMPVAYASISLSRVSGIWYVAADGNTQLDTLSVADIALLGAYYPETVQTGSGFDLGGIVKCSASSVITDVKVEVLAQDGTVVQTASASFETGSSEYALRGLNRDIQFGTLAAGVYVFRIYAADSSGHTVELRRMFTVSQSPTSALYYWSESLASAA